MSANLSQQRQQRQQRHQQPKPISFLQRQQQQTSNDEIDEDLGYDINIGLLNSILSLTQDQQFRAQHGITQMPQYQSTYERMMKSTIDLNKQCEKKDPQTGEVILIQSPLQVIVQRYFDVARGPEYGAAFKLIQQNVENNQQKGYENEHGCFHKLQKVFNNKPPNSTSLININTLEQYFWQFDFQSEYKSRKKQTEWSLEDEHCIYAFIIFIKYRAGIINMELPPPHLIPPLDSDVKSLKCLLSITMKNLLLTIFMSQYFVRCPTSRNRQQWYQYTGGDPVQKIVFDKEKLEHNLSADYNAITYFIEIHYRSFISRKYKQLNQYVTGNDNDDKKGDDNDEKKHDDNNDDNKGDDYFDDENFFDDPQDDDENFFDEDTTMNDNNQSQQQQQQQQQPQYDEWDDFEYDIEDDEYTTTTTKPISLMHGSQQQQEEEEFMIDQCILDDIYVANVKISAIKIPQDMFGDDEQGMKEMLIELYAMDKSHPTLKDYEVSSDDMAKFPMMWWELKLFCPLKDQIQHMINGYPDTVSQSSMRKFLSVEDSKLEILNTFEADMLGWDWNIFLRQHDMHVVSYSKFKLLQERFGLLTPKQIEYYMNGKNIFCLEKMQLYFHVLRYWCNHKIQTQPNHAQHKERQALLKNLNEWITSWSRKIKSVSDMTLKCIMNEKIAEVTVYNNKV